VNFNQFYEMEILWI